MKYLFLSLFLLLGTAYADSFNIPGNGPIAANSCGGGQFADGIGADGTLSCATPSGGGGSPGGAIGAVQYNLDGTNLGGFGSYNATGSPLGGTAYVDLFGNGNAEIDDGGNASFGGSVTADSVSGSGAGLTNIPGSSITSAVSEAITASSAEGLDDGLGDTIAGNSGSGWTISGVINGELNGIATDAQAIYDTGTNATSLTTSGGNITVTSILGVGTPNGSQAAIYINDSTYTGYDIQGTANSWSVTDSGVATFTGLNAQLTAPGSQYDVLWNNAGVISGGGGVTMNGSGNLSAGTFYTSGDAFSIGDNSGSFSIDGSGNASLYSLAVNFTTSLDAGAITTDGSGNMTAVSFIGDGSQLTNLTGANVSGTVNDAYNAGTALEFNDGSGASSSSGTVYAAHFVQSGSDLGSTGDVLWNNSNTIVGAGGVTMDGFGDLAATGQIAVGTTVGASAVTINDVNATGFDVVGTSNSWSVDNTGDGTFANITSNGGLTGNVLAVQNFAQFNAGGGNFVYIKPANDNTSNPVFYDTRGFFAINGDGTMLLKPQPSGTTPTCAAIGDDGKVAITNAHKMCICSGVGTIGWFDVATGLSPCSF